MKISFGPQLMEFKIVDVKFNEGVTESDFKQSHCKFIKKRLSEKAVFFL